MKVVTITVTEAARNFADCVNRAHYQNTSFVLLKTGRPFARIEPERDRRCSGRELAEAVAGAELAPDEAQEWLADLRAARETISAPRDKWR